VSYDLSETEIKNNKVLTFYILEGTKYIIKDINFNVITESLNFELQPFFNKLENYFIKNDFRLDKEIINQYVQDINNHLNSKNIYTSYFEFKINYINEAFDVLVYEVISDPLIVNSINIYGNSITKDKVIRRNILLEPGDYFNKYSMNKSIENLQKKKFIKATNLDFNEYDNKIDINVEIEENKKTGNFLIGGNYSGDIGLGVASTLSDDNIFGTGNQLKVHH
jgi:outer membrane protein insertion porin family